MEQTELSLATIKTRLANLRVQDRRFGVFGSEKHRYESVPVPVNEVERLESRYGSSLPKEYRRFLIEIGFGAGPYYGIHSLSESESEVRDQFGWFHDAEDNANESVLLAMSSDFPFGLSDVRRIEQKTKAKAEEPYETRNCPYTGCIPICFQGCTFSTVLITAGELRGSVWDVAYFSTGEIYWQPAMRPPGIVAGRRKVPELPRLSFNPSFYEWYTGWLDRCAADLAG